MEQTNDEFRRISTDQTAQIRELFTSVFTVEPWNDDWSDQQQLNAYLTDLIGQSNSLTYGLYRSGRLIGVSMGYIRHWYSGTEYFINEFCIHPEFQGKGIGTAFMHSIEEDIKRIGLVQIFLQTENTVPAYQFYQKNGFLELHGHVSFGKKL